MDNDQYKRLIAHFDSKIGRLENSLLRQNCALQSISTLIESGSVEPDLSSFAMAPDALFEFMKLLNEHRPRTIMEFGSGYSTHAVAQYLKRQDPSASFLSFEHDESYYQKTRSHLESQNLLDNVTLQRVDIRKYEDDLIWYDMSSTNNTADLILIDGPPAALAPASRRGAMHGLKNLVREGTLIFLDDFRRKSERETARIWEDTGFAKVITHYDKLQREAAVLKVMALPEMPQRRH